jgi:type I restriction enzyme S subunit
MKWDKEPFLNVVEDITSGNRKFQSAEYLTDGLYPIIDQGALSISGYTNDNNIVKRSKPIIVFGDHTKKVQYVDYDFCLGADGVKVLNTNKKVLPKFLYYFLQTVNLPDVGYSRHYKFLKECFVPIPPLHIQEQIADTLDKADAILRKDKELLTKYDELAQAIFYDMFGDPVKNEKGWQVGFFGDFISVLTDYHSNGSYETLRDHVTLKNTPDYALMVRTTDLEKNNFTDNVNYITKEAYEHLEKSKVFGGEIIINKIGSAGNIYLMPFLNRPVSLGMNAFLVRLKDELNPVFAYYFLNTDFGKYEISKRVFGAVTKTITKDAVRSIPMFIIPKNKQDRFVQYITSINILINKGSITNSSSLFQSLLQKYFS